MAVSRGRAWHAVHAPGSGHGHGSCPLPPSAAAEAAIVACACRARRCPASLTNAAFCSRGAQGVDDVFLTLSEEFRDVVAEGVSTQADEGARRCMQSSRAARMDLAGCSTADTPSSLSVRPLRAEGKHAHL